MIYIAASGIVVRAIAPFIDNKYEDPAVVCVDTAGRQAISLLSGHEGGANWLTYKVAAVIGAQPIVTTGTEVHKKYIIGLGCCKGIPSPNVINAINKILKETKIKLQDIRLAASIDIKSNEKGLIQACDDLDIPLVFFSKEQISRFQYDYTGSEAARRQLGIKGVSEPCALMAGRRTSLLIPKQVINKVTIALVKEN